MPSASFIDWSTIDLVIFDVDGTLYDQRKLRLAMLKLLLRHTWQTRSLDTLLTLRTFRQVREALGGRHGADFMRLQYAQTASQRGKTPKEVRELATEWMEARPLPLLGACRYPHVAELFAGLRTAGKQIAIFSDYPAGAKLVALGLDNVGLARTSAGDPHDRGETKEASDSSDFGDFWQAGELDDLGELGEAGNTVPDLDAGKEAAKDMTHAPDSLAADVWVPPAVRIRPIGPIVCATDADIARLKPDPAGLLAILRLTGVPPERALMIGDRFDRDAVAADRAGVHVLIRSGRRTGRWPTFKSYDDAVFRSLLHAPDTC